jgi:hypothetical protein
LSDDDPRLALQHYQAAVDILINQLKGKQSTQKAVASNASDETEIKNNIISQVEIWMDPSYDLWFVLPLSSFFINRDSHSQNKVSKLKLKRLVKASSTSPSRPFQIILKLSKP